MCDHSICILYCLSSKLLQTELKLWEGAWKLNDSHKCLEFRDGCEANSEREKTTLPWGLGPGAWGLGPLRKQMKRELKR